MMNLDPILVKASSATGCLRPFPTSLHSCGITGPQSRAKAQVVNVADSTTSNWTTASVREPRPCDTWGTWGCVSFLRVCNPWHVAVRLCLSRCDMRQLQLEWTSKVSRCLLSFSFLVFASRESLWSPKIPKQLWFVIFY